MKPAERQGNKETQARRQARVALLDWDSERGGELTMRIVHVGVEEGLGSSIQFPTNLQHHDELTMSLRLAPRFHARTLVRALHEYESGKSAIETARRCAEETGGLVACSRDHSQGAASGARQAAHTSPAAPPLSACFPTPASRPPATVDCSVRVTAQSSEAGQIERRHCSLTDAQHALRSQRVGQQLQSGALIQAFKRGSEQREGGHTSNGEQRSLAICHHRMHATEATAQQLTLHSVALVVHRDLPAHTAPVGLQIASTATEERKDRMQSSTTTSPVAMRGELRRAQSNEEQVNSSNLSWIVCNAPPMPAAMQAGLSGAANAASSAAAAAAADGAAASASPTSAPSAFHLLDLGECRLGAIRTCVILLSNLSDTRADCTLNYTSAAGTVSVEPRQLQIAPRQSVPITIRVQARQLNPSYHKQILIENTQNASNALAIMIRCNNTLDRHGAAFHNLFYHIINPADAAMRAASDTQASPPPPLLPVGFRETAAGKIKREEPQQEEQEQIDSAGPSATATTDDEAASSGRNSARRRRKGSTASTGSRGGADDEIEDLLANVEDDSDLLPPPLIDMESTATRSSEHSTATSPLPVSPQPTMDASAVLTQQSLYQQQLLLQSNSCSTTPSIHAAATAAAAAAASAAECARNSASPVPPAQPTNVIQLGTLVCNHPIMRAIDVKNITSSRLRLRLHSPLDPDRFNTAAAAAAQLSGTPVQPVPCVPEELVLYVKNESKFAQAGLELASDGSMVPRITPFSPSTLSSVYSPSSAHSASTLGSFVPFSLASPVSPQQSGQQAPAVSQPVLDSWCRFESVCVSGEHSAVYSHFADVAAERAYVKKFVMQQRDMEIVLREQMLVRLHEAEAQVAAELGIPPSGKNELVLAPFEMKRVFVFLHIQSRLAVPPLPSGAAPPSLTFVSKDFQRNRLIKLEEKELRARDHQLYSILGLNPNASALPTLDRRRQPTDLLANNVDGSSSTVTSPVPPTEQAQSQPDLAFPAQGSPPVFASPSSQPPIPEPSPASTAASMPLTSSSSASSAAPGLKIFFELVEFPQAISMGAAQASPTAAQLAAQQALRIDPLPPLPAPLLLPSPISGPAGLSTDLQDLLQLQSSSDSGRAAIDGVRSPPRATPLAVSIPDALVSYSDTVTPAMSSAAASPAIGCSAAPIRSLLLPAYLCRSSLEVAQQHINFGQLLNMHVHSKSLVLSNLSEVPLLFMVRQTGSIASLDLTFPRGDIGVIPALGYSDLPFLFKPSLAGKFLEPITILNVQDRADERVINVKAYLRKPVHFWIQNLHMDFRVCCAMGFGAAGWNATPRRTQPQPQQTALQRSTSMQALQRSSSLPPSASVGHLAALAHSFVAPAAPITSSHQRIVVKNISLKPRTFKIKLVEWERTAIKLKRRMIVATNNANNGDVVSKSNETDNSLVPRLAAPQAMTLHAPRPPPLTTNSPSPSPMSPRATTTTASFPVGSSAPPLAGVSLTPESPVMPIETYLSADPLPPGLVPLPAPSLSLKLEDVALSSSSLSAFEREEEEEALNHKLRIAIRKKKTDKIERIRNRLSELRDMRMDQRDMAGSAIAGSKEGEAAHAAAASSGAGDAKDASDKTHDSTEGIIFTLEPNAVQNVRATLVSVLNGAAAAASRSLPPTAPSTPCSKSQSAADDYLVPFSWVELYTGVFHVYETKNKEIIKEVKCSVALASDLQTQEEWRMDSAAWMASDAAEEAATLEEEDEQDEDAQADKNELEQDAQAQVRTDDAAILNSPRSSKTVPDSETVLPTDLQFIRSQSLPTEQFSEVPQLGEQSLSLSALDAARSSADFDATPSSGNASDGYGSPGAAATPTTPLTSGTTGALVPVVPSAAMQQQLMQCASSVLLPASMLAALYLPHSFPLYVPASSSAAQLALSARSHASFFHMLNAHARRLMGGCDPSAPGSMHDVASILALAPASTRSQRGPLIPFEAYIPLEFSSLPALPSMESQSLSSRSRSMPAAHRFSASLKQQEQQASAAAASSYPSPMRLMSGTAASIFRVYIENQVPLSLPSPSFFTLHSHVPTPMIIEVKWIPDADSAQPLSHSESQQHALGYNATHSSMAFGGRSSSQSVGQAPVTLPVVQGVRAESDVPGGYMRVFVKPGTALLAQPNRTADASLPSAPSAAAERRSRTVASAVHRLPARSQSHHISHTPLTTSSSASPITPAPAVSLPPPSQSLFLFLPAHGELDVFMCWLASLLSALDHVAPPPVAHRRTLRRSSSSIGSVGGSGNYPFVSVETQTSPPESNTGHTHRFKKGIALADRAVMAEAVLAPASPDPEDGAAVTSPTNSEGQCSSGSFKKQAPTLSSVGAGKPNPSLRARAGAIYRSSTLMPGQLAHLQSMNAPPAPSLPRGQLLIRPVGFPSIRSMLGVEVCSVSGTAAQQTHVSPLMLTPERIHAGVVLVDMQGAAGADSNPRSLDSRRPSRSGVSSALLWSSSSQAGVVRGRFVIYNSTTAATRSGAMSSAGRVSVIFGSQSKATLTSQFVPSHQRATFQFKPARAVIPANDRRIIDFQCHVRTLGHQTHGILVRDVTNDIDIALPVTFTAKEPVYVRFEDCKEDQFDVGLIYAQTAAPTPSIPSPSSRPADSRWSSRFSKLVPFRVRNVREYDVRVRVASNCTSELHVFDGEGDVQKSRRCLSCAGGFCSAMDSSCQLPIVGDANDPPSIVDAQPSCLSSVIIRSNSTRTLLLAFSPTMSLSSDSSDNTRDFVGGLSFFVFPHRAAANFIGQPTAHPLPTTTQHRLSHSISEPQFIPPLARGSGSQRGTVRFTEEDGTASIVTHGFGDDISEYDDELASDSTNGSARPGTVRKRSVASSTDTEEEDQDDEHGIGSVVSVTHSPADLATDRCLAELNVRVFGRIGVSVFKLEPIGASISFAEEQSEQQRPLLHKMETLHNRVSTVDFFTLSRVQDPDADAADTAQPPPQLQDSQSPHQPLRCSVRLSNLSPLLPLCFRLEPSSANVVANVSSGCLAPLSPDGCASTSSIVLDLSLSCPPQTAVQEWISVLVAQQATVDYQRLEDQKQQQQTCNDPHHPPHCREMSHAASSSSVDSTPQPPSLPHEVVDLLGVREELLHTVFLRCFMGSGDDAASASALRSPQMHLDLPPFSPLPPQGLADESQPADFGSVYVPNEAQPPQGGEDSGSNDKAASWGESDLVLPVLVPAVSRKVAKQKMLESILNPTSASGGGSNGVGVGSGLISPVSPYG